MKLDSYENFCGKIKHNKMDEKAIDGWFQFDYVLDLAKGTENQYIVIG